MHTERRKQTTWQVITQTILPVLIAAFMMWVGSEIVSSKVFSAKLEEKVDNIKISLDAHNRMTREDTIKNAMRHHRDQSLHCTGCHLKELEGENK
jgi:hypothetical protein